MYRLRSDSDHSRFCEVHILYYNSVVLYMQETVCNKCGDSYIFTLYSSKLGEIRNEAEAGWKATLRMIILLISVHVNVTVFLLLLSGI